MRSTRPFSMFGILGFLLLSGLTGSFLFTPLQATAAPGTPWWTNAAPLYPPVPARGPHASLLLPEQPNPPTQVATVNTVFQPFYSPQTSNVGLAPIPLSPSYTMGAAATSVIGVSPNWVKHTSHPKIASALTALGHSPSGASSLETILRLNGKVLFKNLGELGEQYAAFDALAWMDKQNNWMLFINEKHTDAPPEALASLIAHEAMHSDEYNSKQEEAEAWQREARTWMEFQAQHPELKSPTLNRIALVRRLNRLGEAASDASLYDLVLKHPSYAHLPRVSPQYSNMDAMASAQPSLGLLSIRPNAVASVSPGLTAPTPMPSYVQSTPTPDTIIPERPNNLMNILQQRRMANDAVSIDVSRESSLQIATTHQYPKALPSAFQTPQQGALKGIRLEPMPYRQQPSAAASTFIWQTPTP